MAYGFGKCVSVIKKNNVFIYLMCILHPVGNRGESKVSRTQEKAATICRLLQELSARFLYATSINACMMLLKTLFFKYINPVTILYKNGTEKILFLLSYTGRVLLGLVLGNKVITYLFICLVFKVGLKNISLIPLQPA